MNSFFRLLKSLPKYIGSSALEMFCLTLSYMKQRMSRNNKARKSFRVDTMLDELEKKIRSDEQASNMGSYMTLTFLGYNDKNLDGMRDYQVKVETILLKICHKKRKDSSSANVEVSVGSASVPLNPSSTDPPPMASAVSISSESFSPSQGPNVKSYVLLLRVYVNKLSNIKNGDGKNIEVDEPPLKRLKENEDFRLLGCELIVYDKHNRCMLNGGEYELVLHDVSPSVPIIRSPHKALSHTHWETISDEVNIPGDSDPFEIFSIRPTLKLRLSWNQEPTNGLVSRPRPLQRLDSNEENSIESNNSNKENNNPMIDSKLNNSLSKSNNQTISNSKSDNQNNLQIIYQFLYNNNSRQQTEACVNLHCPWCSLDCGRLYALLKHLKLCHSRFQFTYFPMSNGARIDVSINELYDGSYAGSPHEACSMGGVGGSGGGPSRRTPLTHILVSRPLSKRIQRVPSSNALAEFFESDEKKEMTDGQRPYITGHNRLYYHTITCLPIYPKELEIDSEEETDPLWLQQKTMMMIDEFTDVNEGEKELMKMWNMHVMKYNFVGDCQIPVACKMFLQLKGKELLEKNLYRNFVLHLCSLHDFGLITSIVLYETMQVLLQMLAENNSAKEQMRDNIKLQREHWATVGMFQQPTLIDQKNTQNNTKTSSFNGESTPSVRRKTSNMQNTNRSVMNNYNLQSPSTSNDTKKKADVTSVQNGMSDTPQRRKSIQLSNNNSKSSEMPLRRKSAGTNGNNSLINQGRKRLSLQDRKNST